MKMDVCAKRGPLRRAHVVIGPITDGSSNAPALFETRGLALKTAEVKNTQNGNDLKGTG